MKYKEDILRLRSEGKSYGEIEKEIGCSRGTIAYHCGDGQKAKTLGRSRKYRKDNVVAKKVSNFKNPSANRRSRLKKIIKSTVPGIPLSF